MSHAKFTTGSTMRHVVAMTAAGGVGLISLFLVDVLNLFYISLLGQKQLAAAIGFAGSLQFFTISVAIGFSIAATAVVSRAVGAGDRARARRLAASAAVLQVTLLGVIAAGFWIGRDAALDLLGATGETHAIASGFLAVTLPSLPILGVGMVAGGLLRAVGEGRRAMYITLSGGAVAAVIDPLLIFAFGLGVEGAAIALVITRTVIALVGLNLAVRRHALIGRIESRAALGDARAILAIALPAVATQLSTPFGNAFLTGVVATHGDAAVAGWAVVGRLMPLAFGVIFALSGAVGPILGQNRGAGLWDRIHTAYRDALIFAAAWVLAAWALLWSASGLLARGFGLVGDGAEVLRTFTHLGAAGFLFTGALFVANAAFNNLGRPAVSTAFNWARDAAAIPLIALALGGAAGAGGVVLVQAAASMLVGTAAAIAGWLFVRGQARGAEAPGAVPLPQPAFASGRTALAAQLMADVSGPEAPSPLAVERKSR